MKRIRNRIAMLGLAALLAGTAVIASPQPARADAGFDDRYVFAATRGVNDMDVHPAWKVTLFPLTFVVDSVFLPFAVIAGFVV